MSGMEPGRREGMYEPDMIFVRKNFTKIDTSLTEVKERTAEVAEDISDIKEVQISLDEVMRRVGSVVDGLRELAGERFEKFGGTLDRLEKLVGEKKPPAEADLVKLITEVRQQMPNRDGLKQQHQELRKSLEQKLDAIVDMIVGGQQEFLEQVLRAIREGQEATARLFETRGTGVREELPARVDRVITALTEQARARDLPRDHSRTGSGRRVWNIGRVRITEVQAKDLGALKTGIDEARAAKKEKDTRTNVAVVVAEVGPEVVAAGVIEEAAARRVFVMPPEHLELFVRSVTAQPGAGAQGEASARGEQELGQIEDELTKTIEMLKTGGVSPSAVEERVSRALRAVQRVRGPQQQKGQATTAAAGKGAGGAGGAKGSVPPGGATTQPGAKSAGQNGGQGERAARGGAAGNNNDQGRAGGAVTVAPTATAATTEPGRKVEGAPPAISKESPQPVETSQRREESSASGESVVVGESGSASAGSQPAPVAATSQETTQPASAESAPEAKQQRTGGETNNGGGAREQQPRRSNTSTRDRREQIYGNAGAGKAGQQQPPSQPTPPVAAQPPEPLPPQPPPPPAAAQPPVEVVRSTYAEEGVAT